jgi:acyl-CoA reductase-like NAD-dependent aldehyde dehydrogenase
MRTLASGMSAASDLARIRWAKTPPADRSAQMRAIAKHPRPKRRKKQAEK